MENIGNGINQNEFIQKNIILTDIRAAGSISAAAQKGAVTVNKGTEAVNRDTAGAQKDAVTVNKGAVTVNKGAVTVNKGTVTVNKDTAGAQKDAVTVNKGTAAVNKDTAGAQKGAVTVNKGTVTVNKDTAGAQRGTVTERTASEATDGLRLNTEAADIADKALKAAGVADTARNRELTEILIECDRALSAVNIRQLIRQTAAFPDADPRLICRLNASGIAVDEYSLARAADVSNRTAELMYSSQDVLDELEMILQGEGTNVPADGGRSGFLGEILAAINETLNSRNQQDVYDTGSAIPDATEFANTNETMFNTSNIEQNTTIIESTTVDKAQNELPVKQDDSISNNAIKKVEIVISDEDMAAGAQDPLEAPKTVKQQISQGVAGALRQDAPALEPGEALQSAGEGYASGEDLRSAGDGHVPLEDLRSAGDGHVPGEAQGLQSNGMPAGYAVPGAAGPDMSLQAGSSGTEAVAESVRTDARTASASAAAPDMSASLPIQSLMAELKRVCSLRPHEVSQKELGRLHRRLTQLMKRLEKITADAVKKGEAPEGMAERLHDRAGKALKDLGLMRELSENMSYVEIPLRLKDSTTDATLYVYTDGRRRRPDPDDCSALLHLKMPHLGPVDVRAVLKRDTLRLEFISEGKSLGLLERDISSLSEALARKGYVVSTDFKEHASDPGGHDLPLTEGDMGGHERHAAGRRGDRGASKRGFDARA